MKSTILVKNELKVLDLNGKILFGSIPLSILSKIYQDGRILGLIVEHLIDFEFSNIHRVSKESHPYDFISDNGEKLECKTAINKLDPYPSYMKGKGRVYDQQKHLDYLKSIDGFILVTSLDLPYLKIIWLDKNNEVFWKDSKPAKSIPFSVITTIFNNV